LWIVDTYMQRLTTYAKYCAQMFSFLHISYTYLLLLTAQAALNEDFGSSSAACAVNNSR
jgi:hypothetical protein